MAVHIRIEAVVIPVSEIGIAGLPLLLVGSPKNPTTSIGPVWRKTGHGATSNGDQNTASNSALVAD
jgi:hypothetical protein